MKRVRLALGAAGVAPALGLMVPATAAAVAHTPAGTAKTVSLAHSMMQMKAACRGNTATGDIGELWDIMVFHRPSTGCIGGMSGAYVDELSGLEMRTRAYVISGGTATRVFSNYITGHIGPGTTFYQGIHTVYGGPTQQVCGALVSEAHHAVLSGPLCVEFPA